VALRFEGLFHLFRGAGPEGSGYAVAVEPENVLFFESRAALRAWFEANHESAAVLQLGMYKKASGRPSVTYSEALDEALCFGWIDGVRHPIDDVAFTQRFTPRRPRSTWSAVNVRRVEALITQGLMTPVGLRAFEQRDETRTRSTAGRYAAGLPEEYAQRLEANEQAWAFFAAQPPGYQRIALFWVMDAKREETRQRRMEALIADSAARRRIGPLARSK
jgi:uncharacterized protein YdeI (YjbR/CyaY-like superfamily)